MPLLPDWASEDLHEFWWEKDVNWCQLVLELKAFLVAQMVKNPPAMRETWV